MPTPLIRVAVLLLPLVGCSAAPPSATAPPETLPAVAEQTDAAPAFDPRYLIGPRGVGPVKVGRTLADVRAALPDASFRTEMFSGEFGEGDAVVLDGETLAYAVRYPSVDDPDGELVIAHVFVSSPRARTVDGIGPGSLVSAAAAAWGPAELSISEIELGEHAFFDAAPFPMAIKVGARDPDVWRGGVYAEGGDPPPGALTTRFRDDAEIVEIAF